LLGHLRTLTTTAGSRKPEIRLPAERAALVGVLRTDEEKQPIEIRVDEGRPCAPTSPQGLIAGKRTPVWISPSDLNDLIGGTASTSDKELHATLMPLPKDLTTTKPER
jgi:hypothetical protein